ncbi:hypothetical protein EVAR_22324_1 [Eumeta japonica]|uniref:Uncharacterized protein n=1 Tax=Eumeta variegata TaxID=151549 RepID=A0A4C1UBZ7_EUMVA|nr:hypothetical protein EVAR_22324_1 [Eumeta japonica]
MNSIREFKINHVYLSSTTKSAQTHLRVPVRACSTSTLEIEIDNDVAVEALLDTKDEGVRRAPAQAAPRTEASPEPRFHYCSYVRGGLIESRGLGIVLRSTPRRRPPGGAAGGAHAEPLAFTRRGQKRLCVAEIARGAVTRSLAAGGPRGARNWCGRSGRREVCARARNKPQLCHDGSVPHKQKTNPHTITSLYLCSSEETVFSHGARYHTRTEYRREATASVVALSSVSESSGGPHPSISLPIPVQKAGFRAVSNFSRPPIYYLADRHLSASKDATAKGRTPIRRRDRTELEGPG